MKIKFAEQEPKELGSVVVIYEPKDNSVYLSVDPESTDIQIAADHDRGKNRVVIKMPYALIRNFVLDELRKTIIEDLKDMDHAEFEEWLRTTGG